NVFDPPISNLRDVQEAIGTWENLNKSPEIDDSGDRTKIGLADLRLRSEPANAVDGGVGRRTVRGGDRDGTVVLHIDLRTGLFDDGADDLAAGPYDIANLVGIDLYLDNARGMRGNPSAGLFQSLLHYTEDVETAS